MEGGGGNLSELYSSSKRLSLKIRDALERLERLEFTSTSSSSLSSSSAVVPGSSDDQATLIRRDINQIQSLCADMERLWRSIPSKPQRDLWKRKVEQVSEEAESFKASLDKYTSRHQKRIQEAQERAELLGRASGDTVLRIFDEESQAMESVRRSSRLLEESFATGVAILSKYGEQRDHLKTSSDDRYSSRSHIKSLYTVYWNEVAKRRSSVFMDAYNQISKVLFPTYDVFPQHVKMILIYAGAFSQDDNIPVPNLVDYLCAERFSELQNLNKNVDQTLNEFGWKCGILGLKKYGFFDEIRVYSWWSHLFNIEASKDKFLHVLTSGTDFLGGGIKGQRRLCLHSNFIFNFKEVHNSVKCDCASTTRSLLCSGPYHRYSMPLNVGFKLLRVLNAIRVRFYNFPFEILELVLLKYLALTCNGELPTSISKLFNLEFLIICPHMHIKSCGAPSYMPIGIWDMQELRCIQIGGSNLPNPNSASSLQKLSSLLCVSPDNCTNEVFEKIPNLKILTIDIQLKPYVDDISPMIRNCLDHISTLKNLEVLQRIVTNPEVKYEFVAPPTPPLSMFPSSLQKLSLSGLGYSWKHMKAIGSLPNLKVLSWGCNAFRGPKWGTKRKSFLSLESLQIED